MQQRLLSAFHFKGFNAAPDGEKVPEEDVLTARSCDEWSDPLKRSTQRSEVT